MNEGVKVGDKVNDRIITKLELNSANKLGLDVRCVKEDSGNTGTMLIITDLPAQKKYMATHKSWCPRFFTIGTDCKDDKGKNVDVPMSGSGYNKFGEGVKSVSKDGVL